MFLHFRPSIRLFCSFFAALLVGSAPFGAKAAAEVYNIPVVLPMTGSGHSSVRKSRPRCKLPKRR